MQEKADKNFEKSMVGYARTQWKVQFYIALGRIASMDVREPAQRHKIIETIKPFEEFGNSANILEDEEIGGTWRDIWNDFWGSMHRAEQGDPTQFVDLFPYLMQGLMEAVRDEQKGPSTNQPTNVVTKKKRQTGTKKKRQTGTKKKRQTGTKKKRRT